MRDSRSVDRIGPFDTAFYRACRCGLRSMSAEARRLLCAAVADGQGPDGLFLNRAGREDLYYTFFGLLLALATRTRIDRNKCSARIVDIDFDSLDVVHACALLRARRALGVSWFDLFVPGRRDAKSLELLRTLSSRPSNAFPQGDPNSPYSRFLLSTLKADCGLLPVFEEIGEYRLDGGLYSNIKRSPNYGVNATAAAIFLLEGDERRTTAGALAQLQEKDGSFKATANAPCGDLLSTATAFFALQRVGLIPSHSVKPFLRDCFRENGTFAATPDDPVGDLEYTVYGLATMGAIV